ncbi:metallophosphoesterase family protein [Chelatococcus sp. SYSU_G07232]|uniref:Metallophosphoesterase family protein n=1 Tax=Chelatococcus albus TaxID=3047466 RepID=A0ABT7AJT3_9HYPH|nr:metallophosphoesterase family protein [Chelatococcus sp. SYSU_G07232]MDJ1159636.1 metallophosphoesterase family protein [Chelatococcus sp. SYSU_G07232]
MPETVTYAIGDIHGCFDQLARLVFECRRHCGRRRFKFVFLGDYVDRGPDTRKVVEYLMHLQNEAPERVICLKGNHEDMLLTAARSGSPDTVLWWLLQGGLQTLQSYAVAHPRDIPASHLGWLATLPLYHDDGVRFFVHAGVRPGVALAKQTVHDMLWIREPFLSEDYHFGRFVVHGHTPTDGLPDCRPYRLNLDTGAVGGGPLTAAVFLDEAPVEFLSLSRD